MSTHRYKKLKSMTEREKEICGKIRIILGENWEQQTRNVSGWKRKKG